jgi:hypothetical protein
MKINDRISEKLKKKRKEIADLRVGRNGTTRRLFFPSSTSF